LFIHLSSSTTRIVFFGAGIGRYGTSERYPRISCRARFEGAALFSSRHPFGLLRGPAAHLDLETTFPISFPQPADDTDRPASDLSCP
jgi:hypothetical protein